MSSRLCELMMMNMSPAKNGTQYFQTPRVSPLRTAALRCSVCCYACIHSLGLRFPGAIARVTFWKEGNTCFIPSESSTGRKSTPRSHVSLSSSCSSHPSDYCSEQQANRETSTKNVEVRFARLALQCENIFHC